MSSIEHRESGAEVHRRRGTQVPELQVRSTCPGLRYLACDGDYLTFRSVPESATSTEKSGKDTKRHEKDWEKHERRHYIPLCAPSRVSFFIPPPSLYKSPHPQTHPYALCIHSPLTPPTTYILHPTSLSAGQSMGTTQHFSLVIPEINPSLPFPSSCACPCLVALSVPAPSMSMSMSINP